MLVFDHINKTAGTSFRFILENSFGLSMCQVNHLKKRHSQVSRADLEWVKKVFPRLKCLVGHGFYRAPELFADQKNLFLMTFLRDPVSRTISHYLHHYEVGNTDMTLETALEQWSILNNYQVKKIVGRADLDEAKEFLDKYYDFVGLTERFDESLFILSQRCQYNLNLKYQSLNKSARSFKDELLDNIELVKKIEEHNQLDIKLYAFVQEVLYPRYIRQLNVNLPERFDYGSAPKGLYLNRQLAKRYNKLIRALAKLTKQRG